MTTTIDYTSDMYDAETGIDTIRLESATPLSVLEDKITRLAASLSLTTDNDRRVNIQNELTALCTLRDLKTLQRDATFIDDSCSHFKSRAQKALLGLSLVQLNGFNASRTIGW